MGNSQRVLIPKPILAPVGLEGTADLQMRGGALRQARPPPSAMRFGDSFD